MKKLLSILALALCFVACQDEPKEVNVGNDGLVDVVLNVTNPDLGVTRADGDTKSGKNSAYGAIDFFNDADWAKYDVRYILAVYGKDAQGAWQKAFAENMVKCVDEYQEVSFALRLVPNRDYKFVVFADFVDNGKQEDLFYNTTDLENITAKTDVDGWDAMNEARDAYFYSDVHEITETGLNQTIELKRPFAKLRVITTDLDYITNYSKPGYVVVTYHDCDIFKSFNAVSGELNDAKMDGNDLTYSFEVKKDSPYTEGYDKESTNQTLFTDYLLAPAQAQAAVHFSFAVYEDKEMKRPIHDHDFITQIPIQRNHLTTIIGDLLTAQANITVKIDDDFEDKEYIIGWGNDQLAQPIVKSEVKGKDITITWSPVDNAANYNVTINNETPVNTDKTSYTFTGEYETEYTISVVAVPADESNYKASDASTIKVTTEAEPVVEPEKPTKLATPAVKAEPKGNTITLTWSAIANAARYGITVGTEMPVFVEETTYVFTGEYETEYTFNVVAVPADEEKFEASDAATVTATTEAAPAVVPTYTTVAEFLAADEDDTVYTLKGTITAVANTKYGNFDLTDETGTVLIYGLCSPEGEAQYWAESGAKLGDDIVVKTVRTSYNNTPQGKNAIFVELVSPGTLAFYTVNTNAVEFASAGGEQVVNVTAYNTDAAVTATSDNSAFAVSVDGYNVTISAAANQLEEKVTGNITIKVGDLAETVVKASLAAKPAAGVVEGGRSDFNTISDTNTSYVSGKTTAGWAYTNCAIFKGGTSDSSPAFKMIGDASNRALCMNGKTTAQGTITSPTITTGCGTLKFNYGLPFSDTKIKFTVEIIQDGAVVKTFTIEESSAAKLTKYSFEETIDVAGEFQIVFKNLSPSASTSNKDRTAIWDVEWTGKN